MVLCLAGRQLEMERGGRAAAGDNETGRLQMAVSTVYEDNQSLISEIRKALPMMKAIAVDLERDNQFDKVKEMESAVLELLTAYDDVTHFCSAIQSIGESYNVPPADELTDFAKLIDGELARFKGQTPLVPQNQPLFRQFKEAIWNVHHAGQPMPGEEQEDLVMTSTQCNLLNTRCPISGKSVIELENPVRSMDCKHIYEKNAVMHYIKTNNGRKCPVAGCPGILAPQRVVCDPLLHIDIDELRTRGGLNQESNVEDCTELDED